jgi:hypothetical protein
MKVDPAKSGLIEITPSHGESSAGVVAFRHKFSPSILIICLTNSNRFV